MNRTLALTIAALTLASCGSGAANESESATLVDPCTLITDAEVEAITGESPQSHRSAALGDQFRTCHWSDGSSDYFTLTTQTDHQWDQIVQVAQARGADKYRDLPGVGDRAFVQLEANIVAEKDGIAVSTLGQVDAIGELETLMVAILTRLN